jgi:hypothetical protein
MLICRSRVVQTRDQLGDRALPRSAVSHERHDLSRVDVETDVLERRGHLDALEDILRVGSIGEVDVSEFDPALEGRRLHCARAVANGGRASEHFGDPLHARADLPDRRPLLDDPSRRLEHVLDQDHEEHERADRDPFAVDEPHTEPHDRGDGHRLEHADHPAEPGLEADRLERGLHRLRTVILEPALLVIALAQGLHDGDGGEHLVRSGSEIGLA